jgi:AraC-like DNA-binding protein
MALALFLPSEAACRFRELFPAEEVRAARSWTELESLLSQDRVIAAVVDPCADGAMNTDSVVRLMAARRSLPFFAYVPATAPHLQAVFALSKHGLHDAFVHSCLNVDMRLLRAVIRAQSGWLADDFLSRLETRLAALPPEIFRAVRDLFDCPHRYRGAVDIATQAGVSIRRLYRRLDSARIGTPTKLITAAKVLRGYGALRSSSATLEGVSDSIGFENCRQFSGRTKTIFGCSPKILRKESDSAEVILQLLEWLYQPSRRAG